MPKSLSARALPPPPPRKHKLRASFEGLLALKHRFFCHPELVSGSNQYWAKSSDFVGKLIRCRIEFGMTLTSSFLSHKWARRNRQVAFTLAETLITLTIIGVIAALTIPNLITKYQEHVTVSKVKKFYSTMNNALQLEINDNGLVDSWNAKNIYDVINPILKHVKVEKSCGIEANTGCIPNENYFLNGIYYGSYDEGSNYAGVYPKFILADSSSIWFRWNFSSECSNAWGEEQNVCAAIYIDTNGLKKPNKYGVDTFQFMIKKDKVVPLKNNDCTKTQRGIGCSQYIILNGNMDYLH